MKLRHSALMIPIWWLQSRYYRFRSRLYLRQLRSTSRPPASSDHLTVKWLTRGVATGGHASGTTVWEDHDDDHTNYYKTPDGCTPKLYRWRWRARLKARFRNRWLSRDPSSYRLDGMWHEVGR